MASIVVYKSFLWGGCCALTKCNGSDPLLNQPDTPFLLWSGSRLTVRLNKWFWFYPRCFNHLKKLDGALASTILHLESCLEVLRSLLQGWRRSPRCGHSNTFFLAFISWSVRSILLLWSGLISSFFLLREVFPFQHPVDWVPFLLFFLPLVLDDWLLDSRFLLFSLAVCLSCEMMGVGRFRKWWTGVRLSRWCLTPHWGF